MEYDLGISKILISTSKRYPPFTKQSLKIIFRLLDVEKIIFLFECVLLEKKIFLISKHKAILHYVAETLIQLIFPF